MNRKRQPSLEITRSYIELVRIYSTHIADYGYDYDILCIYNEICNLSAVYDFSPHIFKEGSHVGLKDFAGNILIPAIYLDIKSYDSTAHIICLYAAAANKEGKYALVSCNGMGTPITDFIYTDIRTIKDSPNYAVFTQESYPKFGLITPKGKCYVPCIIDAIHSSYSAPAIPFESDGKYGMFFHIPNDNMFYIAPDYDIIRYDSNKRYIARKGEIRGHFDTYGTFFEDDADNPLHVDKQLGKYYDITDPAIVPAFESSLQSDDFSDIHQTTDSDRLNIPMLPLPRATPQVTERYHQILFRIRNIAREDFSTQIDFETAYYRLQDQLQQIERQYSFATTVFEAEGRVGLKDILGTVVIPPIYTDIYPHEPRCYGSWRTYDNTPTTTIAANAMGRYALVTCDGKGTPLTEFVFAKIEPVWDMPWYKIYLREESPRFGLANDAGVIHAYCQIDEIVFRWHELVVTKASGKYGAFTKHYKYITPQFDEVGFDDDDLLMFRQGERWGYITEDKLFRDAHDGTAHPEDILGYSPVPTTLYI